MASHRDGFLGFGQGVGPSLPQLPESLVRAPLTVVDVRGEEPIPMRFIAGMFGVTQSSQTGALASVFGWAVVYV